MAFSRRALVLGALTALVVAACAPNAPTTSPAQTGGARTFPAPIPADRQVTIVFEDYLTASAGVNRDGMLELLRQFQQKFPNIRVESKSTGSQEIIPSVRAQLVAGNPPDIAMLLLREWDVVVENIAPVKLQDIVPPDELSAHFGGRHPLHPNALKLTRRGDTMTGMPFVFSTPTLFYNADIFRQAGLDPDRPPRTWDELQTMGAQIRERTGRPALYISCLELDWCSQAVLLSNGGRVLSEDRTRIMWGERESVEAFRIWQNLVTTGVHARVSASEATDAFAAGNLAMFMETSAVQGRLLNASRGRWELRSAGMPAFGNKPVRPTNSGAGLAILTNDPLKQRAAWELMKFLTSDEAFNVITARMGYLPLRTTIVNDPALLQNWVRENPQILPNLQQLEFLEPSVSFPGDNQVQIRDIYLRTQQQVVLNGADPESTLRDAQQRAQALMPRR